MYITTVRDQIDCLVCEDCKSRVKELKIVDGKWLCSECSAHYGILSTIVYQQYKDGDISFERMAELLGRNFYELREEFNENMSKLPT